MSETNALIQAVHRALVDHRVYTGQIPEHVIEEIARKLAQKWATGNQSWQAADAVVTDALDGENAIHENLGTYYHTAGNHEITAVVQAISAELAKVGMRFTVTVE